MRLPQLVVRSHRPLRLRLFVAAAVLLLGLSGWGLYEAGRIEGGYNQFSAKARFNELEKQVRDLEAKNGLLRNEVALLETSRQVDRKAYEDVDASLADLQSQIQAQREELVFYRGIVSPEDGRSGLQVQELEIIATERERGYRLSLVLIRAIKHDRRVNGVVDFQVEGDLDGEVRTLAMTELAPTEDPLEFNFRYFQDFEREIVLPQGFAPRRVHIEVTPRTKGVAAVSRTFDWVATNS